MWLFPGLAAVLSASFSVSLLRAWSQRRRAHLLAWGIALTMFAVASLAAALGLALGWDHGMFRIYYLFGAVANVPVLGLGTIYLLAPRRFADICAVLVVAAIAFASFQVSSAELSVAGAEEGDIPPASEVAPASIRTLSRYYSFTGFFVVVGGALWSAWKLARERESQLRTLAGANLLIATGTFVVAVGSGFARYGQGSVFALGLMLGVGLMFAGFLRTRARPG